MSLYIASIASGSNGNCYYIADEHTAVLVDTGLTCRETEKRMSRLDLSMDKVKAIFISHEHGDHIKGVEVISAKFDLPVYITEKTLRHSRLRLQPSLTRHFRSYDDVRIDGLTIRSFPKYHDAADPHSFMISGNGVNIGVLTDIGTPCSHVIDHFGLFHAVFLEANYDEAMLANGRYPIHLQRRISGNEGHLSNRQALDLLTSCRSSVLSHVFLSHLSKDNNDPTIALNLFNEHRGDANIIVASRYNETEVYHIQPSGNNKKLRKKIAIAHSVQASLF